MTCWILYSMFLIWHTYCRSAYNWICFGEPAVWYHSRLRGSVEGYLFNLFVMYSHYPWGSYSPSSSLYSQLLSLPPSLLPYIRPMPHPSSLPAALEIHCGIDRKTSLVSLWMLGGIYITDQRLCWARCVSMPVFQSLTFTRQKTCLTFPPRLFFRWAPWNSGIWGVTKHTCLQTYQYLNYTGNKCAKRRVIKTQIRRKERR